MGWYYDDQLNNTMTSVTLHANMYYNKEYVEDIYKSTKVDSETWEDQVSGQKQGRWEPWKTRGKVDSDTFVYMQGSDRMETEYGYGIDPIARSITTEDFNVSIANTWSDFGSDLLSPLWSSVQTIAPYGKNLGHVIDDFMTKNFNEESGIGSKVFNKLQGAIEKVKQFVDFPDAVSYLNKALVSQGTRFSYYGGTGIAFGNLGMKFTLFPNYIEGELKTVNDQLDILYPYIMGKLEPFNLTYKRAFSREETHKLDMSAVGNGRFWENNFTEHEWRTYDLASGLEDHIGDLLNWQSPPGGYEMEMANIDIIQPGTLKLRIGPHYYLNNLVCQDATLNFSKTMVKLPNNDGSIRISPLFCDIALTLRPVSLYSDNRLKAFVSGSKTYEQNSEIKEINVNDRGITYQGKEVEVVSVEVEQSKYNDDLNKSLNKKIENFNDKYRNYV